MDYLEINKKREKVIWILAAYLEIIKKKRIKKKVKAYLVEIKKKMKVVYLVVVLKCQKANHCLEILKMYHNHFNLKKVIINNQIKTLNLLDLVSEEVFLGVKIKLIQDLQLKRTIKIRSHLYLAKIST